MSSTFYTPPTSASSSAPRRRNSDRFFPEIDAPQEEILAYRDRVMNRWSLYRNSHMSRIALSMWYHLGKQWAEVDPKLAFDGVRGALIRQVIGDDNLPHPVTNMISPAVEAEVISLVKRQWVPKIVPTSNDPRIKAAAQVATDSLNYRLEQLSWPDKRHQLALNFVVGGTGLLYTAWDRSYKELHAIGAPTAVFCRSCNTRLYSPEVPVDLLRGGIGGRPVSFAESATPIEAPDGFVDQEERMMLRHCPMCQEQRNLEPFDVDLSEDPDVLVDPFGRSLTVDEPKGSAVLEVDLPFEFYPQDGGLRVQPDTLKRWGRRKIRDLEWVEERAPHVIDDIDPDPIHDLLYDDPFFGQWSTLGSWSTSLDSGILDHHVLVDEVVEMPSFRYPLGRYVLCTKDVVIEDTDLLEEADVEGVEGPETVAVPRAMVSVSQYKKRLTEIWGTTLPEEAISLQNRLNGIDAQCVDTRDRMGSPHLAMPAGMWPAEGAQTDDSWGTGKLIFLNLDPAHPEITKPEVIGGVLMPDSIYLERDRVQQDAKSSMGPGISGGDYPKGVGTTSGLQLAVEQEERSRSLREDSLVNSVTKGWSHLNQLQWALRVDDDTYKVMGPNNVWKVEQYKGAALRGQCETKIERGSYVTKSVITREAHREALADKLIDISTPLARRKMREAYGVDGDVNEDTDNQVDQAERQWVDFVDKRVIPVQDSIDDPMIRYSVFQSMLLGEEGVRLTERAGWADISRKIAGWEQELIRMNTLEAQSIQFYNGRLVGKEAEEAFATAVLRYQEQQAMYEQGQALAQEIVAAGGTPPPSSGPPTPPPPPVVLPQLLQDRIALVWGGMVEKAGGLSGPETPEDMVGRDEEFTRVYVQFRALVDAYRLTFAPLPMPMPMMASAPPPAAATAQLPAQTGTPAGAPAGEPSTPPNPPATSPRPEGGG